MFWDFYQGLKSEIDKLTEYIIVWLPGQVTNYFFPTFVSPDLFSFCSLSVPVSVNYLETFFYDNYLDMKPNIVSLCFFAHSIADHVSFIYIIISFLCACVCMYHVYGWGCVCVNLFLY